MMKTTAATNRAKKVETAAEAAIRVSKAANHTFEKHLFTFKVGVQYNAGTTRVTA